MAMRQVCKICSPFVVQDVTEGHDWVENYRALNVGDFWPKVGFGISVTRRRAQKIRRKLGASANMTLPFPEKRKWMRWRTYERLRTRANVATKQSLLAQLGTCVPTSMKSIPSIISISIIFSVLVQAAKKTLDKKSLAK
jgi:hypothetical protein